ncbi:hypothetical protein K4L44_06100 [Halosquirtibacter laminarini]|uniref:Uncharacterized protein n=1 Tax=Halosquirtibacter laminarini TaxID=3374600 RepID=A0AC61NQ88_9BACT|nr:hypothetical protein K4L44_06100 [Prolixibacteraceae bacterium]
MQFNRYFNIILLFSSFLLLPFCAFAQNGQGLGDFIIQFAQKNNLQVSLDLDALNQYIVTETPSGEDFDTIIKSSVNNFPVCVEKMSGVYVFYSCPQKVVEIKKEPVPKKIQLKQKTFDPHNISTNLKKSVFIARNQVNLLGFRNAKGLWLWNSSNDYIASVSDSLRFEYEDRSGVTHSQEIVCDTIPHLVWAYLLSNPNNDVESTKSQYVNGVSQNDPSIAQESPWNSSSQNSLSSSSYYDNSSVARGVGPQVNSRKDILDDRFEWFITSDQKLAQIGNNELWAMWKHIKDSIEQVYVTASLHRTPGVNSNNITVEDANIMTLDDQYLASLMGRYQYLVDHNKFYVDFNAVHQSSTASSKDKYMPIIKRRRSLLDFSVGYQMFLNKNRSLNISMQEKFFHDLYDISENHMIPEYNVKSRLSNTAFSVSMNYPVISRHMLEWGVKEELLNGTLDVIHYNPQWNNMLVTSGYVSDQFRISPKVLLRADVGAKYFNKLNILKFSYSAYTEVDLKDHSFIGIRINKEVSSAFSSRIYTPSTGIFETNTIYQKNDSIQYTYRNTFLLHNINLDWSLLDLDFGYDIHKNICYLGSSSNFTDERNLYVKINLHRSFNHIDLSAGYIMEKYETVRPLANTIYMEGVSHAFHMKVKYDNHRWTIQTAPSIYLGNPWVLPFEASMPYQNYWIKWGTDIHYRCKLFGIPSKFKLYGDYQGNGNNLKSTTILRTVGKGDDVGVVVPSYYFGGAIEFEI